jgi:formylglycine-generating enzyme required for sulfatase activity/serine/threonine protein kinase
MKESSTERSQNDHKPSIADMVRNSHHNALPNDYRVNWYVIDKVLGVGGFGITYLAHDTNLDQQVAIKEYLPVQLAIRARDHSVQPLDKNKAEDYRWGLRRFISEAQTIAKFDHPNIVRVNSVFESNNTAYMVMRYEEGKNLNEIIKNRRTLSEKQLLSILVPIMNGLERVHNTGFIHRDIKPSNIFIRRDGTPVLLDFGSARQALGHETRTLTSLVSPGYAPYEQYSNELTQQGPWTDIYGMGATLYRLITGVAPVDAVDRSKTFLRDQKDSLVEALEAGEGRYSPRFLMAIDHALAFREEERPQNIAEWRKEFGLSEDEEVATIPGLLDDDELSIDHEATTIATPLSTDATVAAGRDKFRATGRKAARRRRRQTRPWKQLAGATGALIVVVWVLYEPLSDGYHNLMHAFGFQTRTRADIARALIDAEAERQEQERQARVDALLSEAEEHLKPLSLSGPSYRLALSAYRDALKIDPNNAEAESGIRDIVASYVERARGALATDEFSRANSFLDEALAAMPDEPSLLEAKAEVQARKETREQEIQARIAQLMASAQQDIDAGRLTQPRNDSALRKFKDVLSLEPDHVGAQAGLDSLVGHYLRLVEISASQGDFPRGFELLREANRAFPRTPEIIAARDALEERRDAYEARITQGVVEQPYNPRPDEELIAEDAQQADTVDSQPISSEPVKPRHKPEYFRDQLADGTDGPLLARIPAGSFQMGDSQGIGERDEQPLLNVTLDRPFAMSVYEVTFEEYDRFATATGRELPGDRGWGRGRQPVISISWDDARAYAAWLSQQTGHRYRLPSEAEWEYAARGGTNTIFSWGDSFVANRANCESCGSAWDGKQPAPVGAFPANPYGLRDMEGNVYEWTLDCWNTSYAANPADGRPTLEGQCSNRVRRGGSYAYAAEDIRPANRDQFPPVRASNNTGFRMVREIIAGEPLQLSTAP